MIRVGYVKSDVPSPDSYLNERGLGGIHRRSEERLHGDGFCRGDA